MSDEEITLEIEGNSVQCKKIILMENSDYFKAMFEGNFVERNQQVVILKDVDYRSFNIILTCLLTDNYSLEEEEDLLSVLQTACMLQFREISHIITERLNEILSIKNCLKIWQVSESLDLKQLYLKAKNLSLLEFPIIKETDCLLELDFNHLMKYLANVYLNAKSELDVFEICMKWWYEHSTKDSFKSEHPDSTKVFLNFLNCLDYNKITDREIREIMIYPDVYKDDIINQTLNDIINTRASNLTENDENPIVDILLSGKTRKKNIHPSVLLEIVHICDSCLSLFLKTDDKNLPNRNTKDAKKQKAILSYDPALINFTIFMAVPVAKLDALEGYCVMSYKELIFLFGGEETMGRGQWNDNFWVYDTIREKWERKTKLPAGRRHFESCIVDDIVYLVGGTGSFRVLQDNMFWYSYKLDKWSNLIHLPCPGRETKCCEYKNQLFLLNMTSRKGYLFNVKTNNFLQLEICDNKKLVSNFPEKFVVFSYQDFIYVKGSSIITLAVIDNRLEILKIKHLPTYSFDTMETTLCNDTLFTIYKTATDDFGGSVVLEHFSMKTLSVERISTFDNPNGCSGDEDKTLCNYTKTTRLFSLNHYRAVENDEYLREISV